MVIYSLEGKREIFQGIDQCEDTDYLSNGLRQNLQYGHVALEHFGVKVFQEKLEEEVHE